MKGVYFGSWKNLQAFKEEFSKLKVVAPHRPNWNEKSVNIFGDHIQNSKNIYFGLWVYDSENMSYSEGISGSRDSYDLFGGPNSTLCYEVSNIWSGDNYGSKFSVQIGNCMSVELCDSCRNCGNCFGCVGLSNREFCVFNKQYSEDEYWELVDEIKTKMLVDGDYGEFFPPRYLQFPYRTTYVGYFYGFWDFENAAKYGYDVSPIEESGGDAVEGEIVNSDDLPDDIKDVGDDILKKIIFDIKNNKKFRFIKQELDFYRKYGIPLPRENPASRMTSWRKNFGLVFNFYQRKCPRCENVFETSYSLERPENVYCEPCYLKEVA